MTYIYLVENCYGDPNKVYIGKTKNSRKNNHKQTFGKYITYAVIDEINSLSRKDWQSLETFWIEQFKQWGYKIMNNRKKGGSGVEYHTEETKNKMRKPKSLTHKEKLRNRIFTKETCDKISKSKKGYIYSKERNLKISNKLKGRKINWNKKSPIIQYDLNGNFIKEWGSISEATKAGFGYIIGVLKGRQKTAGGYKWKLK